MNYEFRLPSFWVVVRVLGGHSPKTFVCPLDLGVTHSFSEEHNPTCHNPTPRHHSAIGSNILDSHPEITPFRICTDRARSGGKERDHSSHQPASVQLPAEASSAQRRHSFRGWLPGLLLSQLAFSGCRESGCHPTKSPPAQRLVGATIHNAKPPS